MEIEDASDQEQQEISDEKIQKENKDRVDAETMCKKAMETLGETKNRMCSEGEASKTCQKKVKWQRCRKLRKEDLELRRMKLEADSKKTRRVHANDD